MASVPITNEPLLPNRFLKAGRTTSPAGTKRVLGQEASVTPGRSGRDPYGTTIMAEESQPDMRSRARAGESPSGSVSGSVR